MSATTLRTPSYRHHKPSGQAVVTLDGRDIYLGRYGSPESRAEFDRLLAEWLSNGRRLPAPASGSDLTVNELASAYLDHADSYCHLLGGSKPSPSGEGFSVPGHSPGRNRGGSAVRSRSLIKMVESREAGPGCQRELGIPAI